MAGAVLAVSLSILGATILPAAEDTIVAIVNSEVITLKDLREYLSFIYVQLVSEGKSQGQISAAMAQYERSSINQLIEDKLLLDEANRKKVIVNDKILSDRLKQIKGNYGSEQEFLAALSREGLTITDIKNKISSQLKTQFLVETEIKSKILVSPPELTEYYQKNVTGFQKAPRVDLDSIFIPFTPDGKDKEEARKKASEALSLLADKKDFTDVAKQYSQLPSIGMISKGEMLPALESAVFALKLGEITQPLEIETGIYIFKLKTQYPPEILSLDQAKDKIYDILFHEKFRKRLSAWLEDLKKKAYVEIKE